jgi:hypothetical protein
MNIPIDLIKEECAHLNNEAQLLTYLETYLLEQNDHIERLKRENESIRKSYLDLYEKHAQVQIDLFKLDEQTKLRQLMQAENENDFKELLSSFSKDLDSKRIHREKMMQCGIRSLTDQLAKSNQLVGQLKEQLNREKIEFKCLRSSYDETCFNYLKLFEEKKRLEEKFLKS